MNAITFTLNIEPMSLQTSGKRLCVRGGRAMFFKTAIAEKYQSQIELMSLPYRPAKPLEGPLWVEMTFILPRPSRLCRKNDPNGLVWADKRPDRDNLVKGTQDALKGFWLDDAQICDGAIRKLYAEKDGRPRIVVSIRPLQERSAG